MGKTIDLGHRLELHSMDKYCENASISLYQRDMGGTPRFYVHTYSSAKGAEERVNFIRQTLVVMLGLVEAEDEPGWIQFPCGQGHNRALKRAFLDLCKLETGAVLEPKPLTAHDKKAEGNLTAKSLGAGTYEIVPDEGLAAGPKRAKATAKGYLKLCEMDSVGDSETQVRFGCGTDHDAMIGMLLFRAQNVRAAMQEEEMAASKGKLAAPSQQE